jgi:mannosyl-3-phosphoglycerate phosphatase
MSAKNGQWLVVTDLDGTMLDHHSYDISAAKDAVDLLQQRGIPVVLNTSKTFAETLEIRVMLGITDPFIVENGSAIYLEKNDFDRPADATAYGDFWLIELGERQQQISRLLASVQHDVGLDYSSYTRLSQCTIGQAIALTGLTAEQAENAIAREYSEPLIWHSDKKTLAIFQQQLKKYALTTLQGGRFLHVIGNCDKGRAMLRLLDCYAPGMKTVALGDSANDAAMLSAADISVIINSPSNHQLRELHTPDIQTVSVAPEGWREAIDQVLPQLQ